MRKLVLVPVVWLILFCLSIPCFAGEETGENQALPEVAAILEGIEKRYESGTVCSRFAQQSLLAGMGMADEASGNVCFQYPGRMHWHYTEPYEQFVISDGTSLWVYQPAEGQVLTGKMDEVLAAGEGASFFTDIKVLSKAFEISHATGRRAQVWRDQGLLGLMLVPKKPRSDFAMLYLAIDQESFSIRESVTINDAGDIARIQFFDEEILPSKSRGEGAFTFKPPDGTEVIQIERELGQ
ncbi:MAG: outer membrane lipoprotein carrier protein LolA [Desulfatibacillaceae bacterium]|nr:outer membrane lipoprotein carrier protein LolA [Desulfatibacillaceae bacterium]